MQNLRPHPHFDDRGTLDWSVEWIDALARARQAKKLLFIEFGREACGQCRHLVETVVPRPDVAPLLRDGFVPLAADCDDPDPEVEELARKLEGATALPFVLFASPEGEFLEGSSGTVDPESFRKVLERLAQPAE